MPGEKLTEALGIRRALGSFFERALVPVIVIEPGGRLASANDAALAQYGYSLDEMIEMRLHDLKVLPHPELAKDLDRILRGGGHPPGRTPHRRRDGTLLWVAPVAGPQVIDGRTYVVSVLQDTTELVSAEERAHVEHGRVEVLWEGAVERFGGSFALFDRELRILRLNRRMVEWLRRPEEELLGKPCQEVFPKRCSRQPCPHSLALAEQRRVVEEVVGKGGRPLRIVVQPAPSNDTGIALIHVGHDLTEERAMRSRLQEADRLASLGRVAAGVAHEVNNPAAFVTLALPLVKDRIAQGRTAEALSLLDETTVAIAQIADVMRDLGGVSNDRPRAVVDLAAVANGALRIAAHEAEGRARILREFEDGVSVEVCGARIGQVLLNLVLNAAHAIPEGDPKCHRIEVRVRRAGERALLEVADTGPGVPEALGERIFDPFVTTRGGHGGTGLGLWLSRSIVEEESGTLTWQNRPEGGALFTVSLPAHRANVPLAAASAQ
jgi:PAS domain S-box-containing protein